MVTFLTDCSSVKCTKVIKLRNSVNFIKRWSGSDAILGTASDFSHFSAFLSQATWNFFYLFSTDELLILR